MNEIDQLIKELELLKAEHSNIEETIKSLIESHEYDFNNLKVQRLKKRKLWLKDRIAYLESFIYPDIIA
ncbi:MAG: DUF465 domain-containing protein [Sphingobacteriia bacterium]|nr:DUF465 domain-containing protein [Sphingobacteriia bacterium]